MLTRLKRLKQRVAARIEARLQRGAAAAPAVPGGVPARARLSVRSLGQLPRRLVQFERELVRRLMARRAPVRRAPPAQVDELLRVARLSFVQLQAAWDRGDIGAMRELATAQLLEDLRSQLELRGPEPNCTEVLELDAKLLALDDLREALVASVEFSGLIRERVDARAAPFRELWMLANVKAAGPGWKLARVQSLT